MVIPLPSPRAWALVLVLLCLSCAGTAAARSATARIARVVTPVAMLQGVQVELDWPPGAAAGQLRLVASRLDAPGLGYRFGNLDWRCPLLRDGRGGWRCDGVVRSGGGAPFRLSVDLDDAGSDVRLNRGKASITVSRDARTPELTRVDLTRVPLAWTQALLARAWPDARLTGGEGDAQFTVATAPGKPVRLTGPLQLRDLSLDTPDGTIAAEGVGARLAVDATFGPQTAFDLRGQLLGGEALFGTTYLALQQRAVDVALRAEARPAGGWSLPRFAWGDDGIVRATGSARIDADGRIDALELSARSDDLAPLRDGYLSGWLGRAGLATLQLRGAADATARVVDGALQSAHLVVHDANVDDPEGRFVFDGLDGDVRFSAGAPVDSELRWRSGALYGLGFDGTRLAFSSGDGTLRLRGPATVPILGGTAAFDHLQLRPRSGDRGLELEFGLTIDELDVGQLAKALDWPAFTGELTGVIPSARYANDRLTFDGGLSMGVFGGQVQVSALAMERPFGVAPTLSADVALNDLDLEALTGVFGFGSITGRLDGTLDGVRLVDWTPVAFDAELHSDRDAARRARVRQRISQRAVQNISSVGDASFVTSLQGQLIGLFDDFGYRRIGISCVLVDEVCTMDGLGSAGEGFIIVQGSGLPRLTVVGFNRRVDWPMLLERLAAVGSGDVKPVVD
ncbi:MAG: hypothetical protein NDI66_06975 [Pseudomonas sp.]|nr:hypothetical protein [Pseudomonas sp.]